MIRKLTVAGLCAVLWASAAMADNHRFEVIFTGTVTDAENGWVLLGQRARDYAGAGFEARYLVDTTKGQADQGGALYGTPDPLISESITIAGVTLNRSSSWLGQVTAGYSVPPTYSLFQITAADLNGDGTAGFVMDNELSDFGVWGYGSPDYHAWDGDVVGALDNYGLLYLTDDQGNVGQFHLHNSHFTMIALPEPASWAMMVAGFGMAGAALRGRRKAAVGFA